MTTMVGEVYDAFIEAGASPDKARKAAEAVAAFDSRLSKSEGDHTLAQIRAEQCFSAIEQRLTRLEAKVDQLQWMVGLVLAGVAALVVRGLFPSLG